MMSPNRTHHVEPMPFFRETSAHSDHSIELKRFDDPSTLTASPSLASIDEFLGLEGDELVQSVPHDPVNASGMGWSPNDHVEQAICPQHLIGATFAGRYSPNHFTNLLHSDLGDGLVVNSLEDGSSIGTASSGAEMTKHMGLSKNLLKTIDVPDTAVVPDSMPSPKEESHQSIRATSTMCSVPDDQDTVADIQLKNEFFEVLQRFIPSGEPGAPMSRPVDLMELRQKANKSFEEVIQNDEDRRWLMVLGDNGSSYTSHDSATNVCTENRIDGCSEGRTSQALSHAIQEEQLNCVEANSVHNSFLSDADGQSGTLLAAEDVTADAEMRPAESNQSAQVPRRRMTLSVHARSVLYRWYHDHVLHPFPTEAEKLALSRHGGITLKQVNNWFVNTRNRRWKPYVARIRQAREAGRTAELDEIVERLKAPYRDRHNHTAR